MSAQPDHSASGDAFDPSLPFPPTELDGDLQVTCSRCANVMPMRSFALHKAFCTRGLREFVIPVPPFEKGAP